MDGIKIQVTGNIARVIERPAKITSGTVGLPIEFSFDSQWDGLRKIAVFRGGKIVKSVDFAESVTTVPWEVLVAPGVWLSIGVYGNNTDGTEVIPSIWVNVCPVLPGADPAGDPTTDPTLPIWQEMTNYLTTKLSVRIAKVVLRASDWVGENQLYYQSVPVDGVTKYSQVDLKPSAEQLALFRDENITMLSTENENCIVTVYAVGAKPVKDYAIEVSITEVVL